MNEPGDGRRESADFSREEMMSALFVQMVIQQSNVAMMLLGKVPHPESGQIVRDLDGAKLFIDQLEMLEAKTKGNLTHHEEGLLKQSLMALRLAFVEAVESPEPAQPKAAPPAPPANPAGTAPTEPQNKTAPAETAGAAGEEESRKRYSKKFSL